MTFLFYWGKMYTQKNAHFDILINTYTWETTSLIETVISPESSLKLLSREHYPCRGNHFSDLYNHVLILPVLQLHIMESEHKYSLGVGFSPSAWCFWHSSTVFHLTINCFFFILGDSPLYGLTQVLYPFSFGRHLICFHFFFFIFALMDKAVINILTVVFL